MSRHLTLCHPSRYEQEPVTHSSSPNSNPNTPNPSSQNHTHNIPNNRKCTITSYPFKPLTYPSLTLATTSYPFKISNHLNLTLQFASNFFSLPYHNNFGPHSSNNPNQFQFQFIQPFDSSFNFTLNTLTHRSLTLPTEQT